MRVGRVLLCCRCTGVQMSVQGYACTRGGHTLGRGPVEATPYLGEGEDLWRPYLGGSFSGPVHYFKRQDLSLAWNSPKR